MLTELVERDTDVSSRDPDRPSEDAEGDLPGLGLFRVAVPEEGPGLVPRPVGTGEVERRGLPGVGVEDLQRGTADRRVIAAAGARQGETAPHHEGEVLVRGGGAKGQPGPRNGIVGTARRHHRQDQEPQPERRVLSAPFHRSKHPRGRIPRRESFGQGILIAVASPAGAAWESGDHALAVARRSLTDTPSRSPCTRARLPWAPCRSPSCRLSGTVDAVLRCTCSLIGRGPAGLDDLVRSAAMRDSAGANTLSRTWQGCLSNDAGMPGGGISLVGLKGNLEGSGVQLSRR